LNGKSVFYNTHWAGCSSVHELASFLGLPQQFLLGSLIILFRQCLQNLSFFLCMSDFNTFIFYLLTMLSHCKEFYFLKNNLNLFF